MKRFMTILCVFGMAACATEPGGEESGQQQSALSAEDQAIPAEDAIAPSKEYLAVLATKLAIIAAEGGSTDRASPRAAACGAAGPNLQNQVIADAAINGAARQRTGSSTGCTARGELQPSDDALYFCFTLGNDNFTWTYNRNQRTGVLGWTRDDLLRNVGSNRFCGF